MRIQNEPEHDGDFVAQFSEDDSLMVSKPSISNTSQHALKETGTAQSCGLRISFFILLSLPLVAALIGFVVLPNATSCISEVHTRDPNATSMSCTNCKAQRTCCKGRDVGPVVASPLVPTQYPNASCTNYPTHALKSAMKPFKPMPFQPVKQPQCSRAGYSKGEWVYVVNPLDTTARTGLDMSYHEYHKVNFHAVFPQAQPQKWEWKPTDDNEAPCKLKPFDSDMWCAAMGNGNMLIVGDSLSANQIEGFRGQFSGGRTAYEPCERYHGRNDFNIKGYNPESTFSTVVCPSGSRADYIRNDHLTLRATKEPCSDVCFPWVNNLGDYSVLIVNTGMHVTDIVDYQLNMRKIAKFIASSKFSGQVFYRSSVAGNMNCMDHNRPFKSYEWNDTVKQESPSDHPQYNWGNIQAYNALAEMEFKKHLPSAIYMDVDSFSKLRPDTHRSVTDCVHYTMPSVPDYWLLILYNYVIGNIAEE